MTRQPLHMKRFATAICGLVVMEWALFELLRAPYRPPQDMTTLLGSEKYGVILFMAGLAICGFGYVSWAATRSVWTRRSLAMAGLLLSALAGAGVYVAFCPSWPVTPMHWILR